MFDAKVLIKRLRSFSVPKITVIRCSKLGRPEQSYEKPLVPLSCDTSSETENWILFYRTVQN